MTVQQAIEKVRQVGSVELIGGEIRYEIRRRGPETTAALTTLRTHKPEVLEYLSVTKAPLQTDSLDSVVKGTAIELWSDAAGRLFLVADDADVQLAMKRIGARRGEIYTAAEARRITAISDPVVVAEIHEWKREFDGTIQEFHREDDHK